jgi:outer membrane protein TolC
MMVYMNISRIPLVLLMAGWFVFSAPAQSAPLIQTISLSQAVDQALKTGDGLALVQDTLEAAQGTNGLAQAKNGFTVSTALSYGASQSFNSDQTGKITTAPSVYGTTNWPYGVVDPTSSVGALTTNNILLQSPTATITAGTPITSLTVGAGAGLETYPDGTYRNVEQGSAKLSQTLWNGYWGGPTQASADQASLAFQIALLTAQASRNTTILAVKQAYYTMLSAQENLNLLKTTVESRKLTVQFVQAEQAVKEVTDVDVLTAQVNEQSAELDLESGQNALNTARQRLANLMGVSPDTQFAISPEPDPAAPAADLAGAVALGLKNRTEPQIADLNARVAQINQALAFGSTIPSVTVTGGVTDYLDTTANKSTLVGQVGVTLGAALWDAGALGSEYKQAERTLAGYNTQKHQLAQSIPVDIEEAWKSWQEDVKRYELSLVNRKANDLQLDIVNAQFKAHIKTISDVFIAEINATTAEFGVLTAKITAQLAALNLQNLLGL